MNIDLFTSLVIKPTLSHLAAYNLKMNTKDSLILMKGTVLLESAKGDDVYYNKQMGDGPALSAFQVEPNTMFDNYTNFINARQDLNLIIDSIMVNSNERLSNLEFNPFFACAHARVKYWRAKGAIPKEPKGKAQYYKDNYNSHLGKANLEKAIAVFKCLT